MINPHNPISDRPPFNSLQEALAAQHLSAEKRRAQQRLARDTDPEWIEKRRIRREIADKERADKAAKAAEAAKHAMIGWPGRLGAHVDRGSAQVKASFLPYLERALRDYESEHPDQAPAPTGSVIDDVMHRREMESRARAKAFLSPGTDRAKLLAAQPAFVGGEEFKARHAARHALRQEAADPIDGENHLVGETSPMPPPVAVHDAEPPKRGRGRPPKFIAEQRYEVTEDGALIED